MINDRQITITCGASRWAKTWQPQTTSLAELYARLEHPARSTEPLSAYMALPKAKQDTLKDVGGFVAGTLIGGRRKAGAVCSRDVLTLDLDSIPAGGTDAILRRVGALGCGYCVYSTRKHCPAAPRLRILIPLDRSVPPDEYEAITRRAAEMIDINAADPSTFEPSRLMYWPSCSSDSEYIFKWDDKPMLSADGMLQTYKDWRDISTWPQVPGAAKLPKSLAAKQEDPEAKRGLVGAFCRTYDVVQAMEAFLPGVYEQCDLGDDRYTYTGGSTTGGAVVYDNGKYLYSHHATDPCSGRLVNAFDLVRLHRFGDLDDDAKDGTPTNRLPSFEAMLQLAGNDAGVQKTMAKEKADEIAEAFGAPSAPVTEEDTDWLSKLKRSTKSGQPLPTIDNVWLILEHDPRLKGKFALNKFAGRGEVLGALPWCPEPDRRPWDDNDSAGLYWYVEKVYNISSNGRVDSALSLHSRRHSFNDVTTYLSGLTWDGVPRLETLFVDYLGAEDTPYTRAVTRKSLVAAVARAMAPGTKYDQMVILSGPQGIGKSTMLYKLSRGWFNDSIRTFEGKEASELLQGVWLVEIAELQAFRTSDINRIKQFVSLQADRFRAAYGRHVKEMPRCCVFFGTTNSRDYLQDRTGNRRFWPIDAGILSPSKSVFRDLDEELDQIWAEAVVYWRLGEPLYLTGELAAAAAEEQEGHRESTPREGIIADFLEREIPEDWSAWPLDRRRMYWSGGVTGEIKLAARDRVCAIEIWCEAFGGNPKDMRYQDAREINDIMTGMAGWARSKKAVRCGPYGPQKGFVTL